MIKNRLLPAALLAATVLTTGCVVTPDPYYDRPVRVAPPPLRQEYPGYAPYADYVWISGYWGWAGARYEWIPGRWEAPRHGHIWVPHRWERDGDHWRQSGGRWEQDNRPRPAPRIEVQPAPHYERDNPPPRREWGGDSRDQRDAQPRGEPRYAPPAERDNRSRYERRDDSRPAEARPAYRTERGNAPPPESRQPATAAPAPQRGEAQGQVRGGDRSRGERRDESRGKRRQPGDER
ncbi:MAG: BcpO-related WXXGXW repeat protein [Azonexaceae bacterium]|nr:BcpO-related WXXGXW repeat protein [Azonexaceae bacterium]